MKQERNHFYNPVRICQGDGALKDFRTLIEEMEEKPGRVLILARSEDTFDMEEIRQVLESFQDCQVTRRVFTQAEPDLTQLYQMYEETCKETVDLVVGIGGGSTLDVAKSLCCLYASRPDSVDTLRRMIVEKELKKPACRWIGIPTTAGTGSEVTCWATIWDREKNQKLSIDRQDNYAYAAFEDPALTVTMPLNLAVSSALDAMAHAAEAYWSKHTNVVSRSLALTAIREIMEWLPVLIENPKDLECHRHMGCGSMMAGLAFSNTRTTACHSISYPLTLSYHIPHGIAVSMLIAPVMDINISHLEEPDRFAQAFGVSGPEQVGEKIRKLLAKAGIPARLRDWGVREEELSDVSSRCFTKGRMDNNPVELSKVQVEEILRQIF